MVGVCRHVSFAYSLLGASFSARELRLAPVGNDYAQPLSPHRMA
jgi:hypothetical protein